MERLAYDKLTIIKCYLNYIEGIHIVNRYLIVCTADPIIEAALTTTSESTSQPGDYTLGLSTHRIKAHLYNETNYC